MGGDAAWRVASFCRIMKNYITVPRRGKGKNIKTSEKSGRGGRRGHIVYLAKSIRRHDAPGIGIEGADAPGLLNADIGEIAGLEGQRTQVLRPLPA